MRWDIELNPRAEAQIMFSEEETIEYRVAPVDGTEDQELPGTITVDDESSDSGILVVLIDDELEPAQLTVKTDASITWKNNRSTKVRLYTIAETVV